MNKKEEQKLKNILLIGGSLGGAIILAIKERVHRERTSNAQSRSGMSSETSPDPAATLVFAFSPECMRPRNSAHPNHAKSLALSDALLANSSPPRRLSRGSPCTDFRRASRRSKRCLATSHARTDFFFGANAQGLLKGKHAILVLAILGCYSNGQNESGFGSPSA